MSQIAGMVPPANGPVEYGIAARTYPGEIESGDLPVIACFADRILIAAVDGLGHGCAAAAAAQAAVDTLREYRHETAATLMLRCHEALRKTRGAALSLALIGAGCDRLTWVGVGNVEGALFRADPAATPRHELLRYRGGVVGFRMPLLHVATLPIGDGDTLVLATDGITSQFCVESPIGRIPQDAADHIMLCHARPYDDALVIVARFFRPGAP